MKDIFVDGGGGKDFAQLWQGMHRETRMDFSGFDVGYDIPALPGMAEAAVQTPCLLLDLDALERNIIKMGKAARAFGVRHRVHGKMHKSVDVAVLQMRLGGACGVCCQKVSEAEAFVRGGVMDVLVSNQVTDPTKIDRLARLVLRGARVIVCVDDAGNVADLAAAARRHGVVVECLVEMDVGAGRCGVRGAEAVVGLARAIEVAEGLRFAGVQAYQGTIQHLTLFADRRAAIEVAVAEVRDAVAALRGVGLECDIIGGAGTGSYVLEGSSGVYNELQCGSYAFMDADYGRVLDQDGRRLDQGAWENALFVLTSVMSHVRRDWAVCDAGLKAVAVDSGLPVVFRQPGLDYLKCSDEHGEISDPDGVLKINDKLRLVPGHCDPTCNLHDWYVGVRGGKVEVVWPISARGKGY